MAHSSCHVNVPKINHDVFISFRGADVRRGLLSHLKKELRRGQIDAYVDDRFERGDEISSSLVRAIEGSQILLVIFSKHYASSRWCLKELVKIVECMERNKQIVIPIFYNVDPSDVRHQKGAYGAALTKHVKDFKENMARVQNWISALQKAAQLSGFHYPSSFENESDLVDEIVKDVSNKLSKLCLSDLDDPSKSNGLVGIDQNIAWIKSLLTTNRREVLKLGIWGMGGIGKTTIARIAFDTFSSQYEGFCFLENVREELENYQLSYLREKLVSELLEKENPLTYGKGKSSCYTKRMLRRMKVLIVLDDVNNPNLLKGFLEPIRFGLGSTVIVTSRDKQVFNAGGFHEILMVNQLNLEESLKLFCLNAFNESQPKIGYEELSQRAVAFARGIPLALKVFGSYFHSKSTNTWECALKRFKKYPDREIQSVLRLSYDGLHHIEKKIFLDIAFFFKDEDKDYVISQLDAWNFYGTSGIQALQDKALITISNENRIQMHDLIQEMGWEVVRQESTDVGRRSRLRYSEEVHEVLKNNKGTDVVEGMLLDVSQMGEIAFNFDSLKSMPNLRFLKICSVVPIELPSQISIVPKDIPNVNLKGKLHDMTEKLCRKMIPEVFDEYNRWQKSLDVDGALVTEEGTHVVDAVEFLNKGMRRIRLLDAQLDSIVDDTLKHFFNSIIQEGSGMGEGSWLSILRMNFCKALYIINRMQNAYSELCDEELAITEPNSIVSGSNNQFQNPDNINIIASALRELQGLGCEVHAKVVEHMHMDGFTVAKEYLSTFRELGISPLQFGLLNVSGEYFSFLDSQDGNDGIVSLQLSETLPDNKELHFLRLAFYGRFTSDGGREQEESTTASGEIKKPKLRVLFDGLRLSRRLVVVRSLILRTDFAQFLHATRIGIK